MHVSQSQGRVERGGGQVDAAGGQRLRRLGRAPERLERHRDLLRGEEDPRPAATRTGRYSAEVAGPATPMRQGGLEQQRDAEHAREAQAPAASRTRRAMRSAASGTARARARSPMRGQLGPVCEKARHGLQEALRRERDLRQEHGAARRLDQPCVGRLLVAAGARQRDVERRAPEMAALVHRARPASPHDQLRRRLDVAELGADVGPEGVAAR